MELECKQLNPVTHYTCSRVKGHLGKHVAMINTTGEVVDSWEDTYQFNKGVPMAGRLSSLEFHSLKSVQERFGIYGMLDFVIANAGINQQQLISHAKCLNVGSYLESMGLEREARYELVMK